MLSPKCCRPPEAPSPSSARSRKRAGASGDYRPTATTFRSLGKDPRSTSIEGTRRLGFGSVRSRAELVPSVRARLGDRARRSVQGRAVSAVERPRLTRADMLALIAHPCAMLVPRARRLWVGSGAGARRTPDPRPGLRRCWTPPPIARMSIGVSTPPSESAGCVLGCC